MSLGPGENRGPVSDAVVAVVAIAVVGFDYNPAVEGLDSVACGLDYSHMGRHDPDSPVCEEGHNPLFPALSPQ